MVTLDSRFSQSFMIEKNSNNLNVDKNLGAKKKLSPIESEIFKILKDGSVLGIDQIIEFLRFDFSEISSALTMMEIKGLLCRRTDGRFELK